MTFETDASNKFSILSDFNYKFSQKGIGQSSGFRKPPNGPMRDRITVDILKIDENDFKGTISPIEAKNLIYINTLGLDRNLLHSLDISFKGHPVITYCLREQINVDTTLSLIHI